MKSPFSLMSDASAAMEKAAPLIKELPDLLENFRGFLGELRGGQVAILAKLEIIELQNNRLIALLTPGDLTIEDAVAAEKMAADDPRNKTEDNPWAGKKYCGACGEPLIDHGTHYVCERGHNNMKDVLDLGSPAVRNIGE